MCSTVAQDDDSWHSPFGGAPSHRARPLVVPHHPNDWYHIGRGVCQVRGERRYLARYNQDSLCYLAT